MSMIHEIEEAVSRLSHKDLVRFRQWFEEFDASVWDERFEQDAKSGKLDKLAEKAVADFRTGRYKEL